MLGCRSRLSQEEHDERWRRIQLAIFGHDLPASRLRFAAGGYRDAFAYVNARS
jgi:hypothetical protein